MIKLKRVDIIFPSQKSINSLTAIKTRDIELLSGYYVTINNILNIDDLIHLISSRLRRVFFNIIIKFIEKYIVRMIF